MAQFKHPNVVTLHGVVRDGNTVKCEIIVRQCKIKQYSLFLHIFIVIILLSYVLHTSEQHDVYSHISCPEHRNNF